MEEDNLRHLIPIRYRKLHWSFWKHKFSTHLYKHQIIVHDEADKEVLVVTERCESNIFPTLIRKCVKILDQR